LQINSELPDSQVVTLNADLNQPSPPSGDKMPLADLLFTVNSSLPAGTYPDAASLSPLYQLKPFADASNILIDSPMHYSFSGNVATGVPLRVAAPEVVGLLATTSESPLFDTASFQGSSPLLHPLSCGWLYNIRIMFTLTGNCFGALKQAQAAYLCCVQQHCNSTRTLGAIHQWRR
jgi:hypothetical protein